MVVVGKKYEYFYNKKNGVWYKAVRLKNGRLRIIGKAKESEIKGKKKKAKRKKNVYLGTKVKDIGRKGLDTLKEVRDICRAIIDDYKKKRIPYAKAMRRLVFLQTTVIPRNSKMSDSKKKKALDIVERFKKRLMRMRR